MVDMSKMTMPVIAGGLVAGVLSGIPVVSLLCCLWYILGGGIAAWMLIGKVGKIELMDGAIVGGISGVIAGIIAGILGIIASMVFTVGMGSMLGDIPGAADVGITAITGIVGIFIGIILGAIFGAIGGVIVAKLKE